MFADRYLLHLQARRRPINSTAVLAALSRRIYLEHVECAPRRRNYFRVVSFPRPLSCLFVVLPFLRLALGLAAVRYGFFKARLITMIVRLSILMLQLNNTGKRYEHTHICYFAFISSRLALSMCYISANYL